MKAGTNLVALLSHSRSAPRSGSRDGSVLPAARARVCLLCLAYVATTGFLRTPWRESSVAGTVPERS